MVKLPNLRLLLDRGSTAVPLGIAADGTVSAATPAGTLVVQLCGETGTPQVVMSVQEGLGACPRELDRYRLRDVLAVVLRAGRSVRARDRLSALALATRLPGHLKQVQRVVLAQFVCINFEAMMVIAHAWAQQPSPGPRAIPS